MKLMVYIALKKLNSILQELLMPILINLEISEIRIIVTDIVSKLIAQ